MFTSGWCHAGLWQPPNLKVIQVITIRNTNENRPIPISNQGGIDSNSWDQVKSFVVQQQKGFVYLIVFSLFHNWNVPVHGFRYCNKMFWMRIIKKVWYLHPNRYYFFPLQNNTKRESSMVQWDLLKLHLSLPCSLPSGLYWAATSALASCIELDPSFSPVFPALNQLDQLLPIGPHT